MIDRHGRQFIPVISKGDFIRQRHGLDSCPDQKRGVFFLRLNRFYKETSMLPKFLQKVLLFVLLASNTLTITGCASGGIFSKAPPTSDSRWADEAGGLPSY